MFQSQGRLQYDPESRGRFKPWWLILECRPDIALYYRWWLRTRGLPLQPTPKDMWGSHVSVVRGEPPPSRGSWGAHQGRVVRFTYTGELASNGKHFWVPVQSPELEGIRAELGLSAQPPGRFHLTIGVVPEHIPYPSWLEDLLVQRR